MILVIIIKLKIINSSILWIPTNKFTVPINSNSICCKIVKTIKKTYYKTINTLKQTKPNKHTTIIKTQIIIQLNNTNNHQIMINPSNNLIILIRNNLIEVPNNNKIIIIINRMMVSNNRMMVSNNRIIITTNRMIISKISYRLDITY